MVVLLDNAGHRIAVIGEQQFPLTIKALIKGTQVEYTLNRNVTGKNETKGFILTK